MAKRILVIGVGSIGERHVRCFLATGRATVSIVDSNERLRADVAGRYGDLAAYDSIPAALRATHDAAVICTPAHVHIPMATELAKAGVSLLIEKPLSTNLLGIQELQSVIELQRVKAGVAYVLRHHPALVAMRDSLLSGRWGKPVQVVANSGQNFPTYRPAYRQTYYTDRATGGGAIQDALTHVMNAAQWLVGPATQVAADAGHQLLDGVTVEDTAHVLARHGDVLAIYSLNQYQAPNESTLTVVCTEGTLRFEYHQSRFRWMSVPDTPWQDETFGPLERDTLFIRQAQQFVNTMDGAPPSCSVAEGVQSLRTTLAILAAVETRKWVDVVS
jgi:predicted dehydrogenase